MSSADHFDVCIVGAGVVGLAIAYQLSLSPKFKNRSIVVVEEEATFGQHISSRNSEVIHAGIYYKPSSLKSSLCVRGRELLYPHCEKFNIPHQRIGKYIVGGAQDRAVLEEIKANAANNGVDDLQWLDKVALRRSEPALNSELALLSPSTGIIDSHQYMQSLLHLAENNGVIFAPHTKVLRAEHNGLCFTIDSQLAQEEQYKFRCDCLINSAGLNAQGLALNIDAQTTFSIPQLHLCKGDYFNYLGKNPFSHLIYPLPERNETGLGIHATIDMSGQLRFGPDAVYTDEQTFDIDGQKSELFARAIARYFPAITADKLAPAYSGVRPKLSGAGDMAADFQIQSEADHSVPGLILLFGIESPGLTSSLAIGETVLQRLM